MFPLFPQYFQTFLPGNVFPLPPIHHPQLPCWQARKTLFLLPAWESGLISSIFLPPDPILCGTVPHQPVPPSPLLTWTTTIGQSGENQLWTHRIQAKKFWCKPPVICKESTVRQILELQNENETLKIIRSKCVRFSHFSDLKAVPRFAWNLFLALPKEQIRSEKNHF